MKKILSALCISLLLLTSCGETVDTGKKVLETGSYVMTIPTSWYIIDDSTLKTSLPEGSYRAARATLAIQGTYAKLTITKETLLLATSSLKYADANIIKAPLITSQYTKLAEQDMEIAKQKTKLHIFQAKTATDAPLLLYIQAYVLKDEHEAYTISFSSIPSEKNYDKYITYIKTFQWK